MRTRLRVLHLQGRTYRWTARIGYTVVDDDIRRCIQVRVRAGGKTGCVLMAHLISNSPPGPWGICTDSTHPTPRDMHTLIEQALAQGWDPDTMVGGFTLRSGTSGTLSAIEVHRGS
ncbi:hypothetical protein OG455_09705 [Kitasatospora sp. NBC_01287]|uniref:hypothetical protein n=1 Tax=Kitasatospora sp. NBC_01287 TaxID=2903573 RepID=UPI00224D2B4C|nr:hypothetical protein [Kitasatospora sp. NBC_01287]MCX4745795.1 hypothetical protein [Kitasatospora sp. NBC_01287]